jgi:hypothetical protein
VTIRIPLHVDVGGEAMGTSEIRPGMVSRTAWHGTSRIRSQPATRANTDQLLTQMVQLWTTTFSCDSATWTASACSTATFPEPSI